MTSFSRCLRNSAYRIWLRCEYTILRRARRQEIVVPVEFRNKTFLSLTYLFVLLRLPCLERHPFTCWFTALQGKKGEKKSVPIVRTKSHHKWQLWAFKQSRTGRGSRRMNTEYGANWKVTWSPSSGLVRWPCANPHQQNSLMNSYRAFSAPIWRWT